MLLTLWRFPPPLAGEVPPKAAEGGRAGGETPYGASRHFPRKRGKKQLVAYLANRERS
jgi:hypothetical protein